MKGSLMISAIDARTPRQGAHSMGPGMKGLS